MIKCTTIEQAGLTGNQICSSGVRGVNRPVPLTHERQLSLARKRRTVDKIRGANPFLSLSSPPGSGIVNLHDARRDPQVPAKVFSAVDFLTRLNQSAISGAASPRHHIPTSSSFSISLSSSLYLPCLPPFNNPVSSVSERSHRRSSFISSLDQRKLPTRSIFSVANP